MLEDLLATMNNWFEREILRGTFEVSGGTFDPPGAAEGQWVRVVGSVFNDGLHRLPASGMHDEVFTGEVWLLAVPSAVEELGEEISEWVSKHPETDLVSESFDGYSYTRASTPSGSPAGWRSAFRDSIRRWAKI